MTISAKYSSVCPRCSLRINVNDRIVWNRGMKAVHEVCPDPTPENVVVVVQPALAVVGGIANVVALLTKVAAKLKAPKMRFLAPDGASELRLSLAAANGKNAGFVYVKVRGEYLGKIAPDGTTTLQNAPLLATLTTIGNDPAAAAKAYGAFCGRCSFCGLELTDAGSVEVGYGAKCAANYSLPHKHLGTPELKKVGRVPKAKPVLPDAPSEPLSYGKPALVAALAEPEPVKPKEPVYVDGIRIID